MTSINNFLNANPKCKAFSEADTNLNFCKDASNTGANCSALGVVGASSSPGCSLTSTNLETMISALNDCQTRLFQAKTIETVNSINANEHNLLGIAQEEISGFNIEIKQFESSVNTQINKLEVTNGILMAIIIITYVFLGITVNFR